MACLGGRTPGEISQENTETQGTSPGDEDAAPNSEAEINISTIVTERLQMHEYPEKLETRLQ